MTIKHLVVGNGSNLLVRDSGYQGVYPEKSANRFQQILVVTENRIEAEAAGVLLSAVGEGRLAERFPEQGLNLHQGSRAL